MKHGMGCLQVEAFPAAAVMFRRALEQLLYSMGFTHKYLGNKVNTLKDSREPKYEQLKKHLDEINYVRTYGDTGAHYPQAPGEIDAMDELSIPEDTTPEIAKKMESYVTSLIETFLIKEGKQ